MHAKKRTTKSRQLKILRLKTILKKLDSIEETPANASKIRAIENRVDDVLRKHKIDIREVFDE